MSKSKLPRQLHQGLDPDLPANRVVIAFGGAKQMSRLTDFKISTIYSWQRAGLIPAKWRYDDVLRKTESYFRYLQRIGRDNQINLPDSVFLEDVS